MILNVVDETTWTVFGSGVMYLKWYSRAWLLHYLSGSYDTSPLRALNLFVSCLRLVGINLGSRMINYSSLCPIIPHNLQIIFWLTQRSKMTVWRETVSLFSEDEFTNIVIALNWRFQVSLVSNCVHKIVDTMNISPLYIAVFPLL